ncbi:helicase SNF [Xylanibacillus composti]|uniref:Helicase SNF n=1 Tax=Xylanibacillus composti TaxID=1572762 RepID=A0A8J4H407_9BACL|nr:DEAD/DEAH box helicase [Xylanibacillus composti]MDT9725359.1 helicase SNF [Xylanibacillus composti]GIQ69121.1 helicase SNF [Xylanibacillus composti]
MRLRLTRKSIKQWCGTYAYQTGERLSRTNKVRFVQFDKHTDTYIAEVSSSDLHEVSLAFPSNDKPEAHCSCPSLASVPTFCQHIAAALIQLYTMQPSGHEAVSSPQIESKPADMPAELPIAERILELLDDKPARPLHNQTLAETRTPLEAAFILKLLSVNPDTAIFGIELKIGPRALYMVKQLSSFLEHLVREESYVFSSRFSYEPELHTFSQENEAVLQALIDIANTHTVYRGSSRLYSTLASDTKGNRILPIPPQAWKGLLPLLAQAPRVVLMDGDQKYDGISVTAEPLPLRFAFREAQSDNFALCIYGLEPLTVMEPYEMAFLEGKLFPLTAKQSKQLPELKKILAESGQSRIVMQRDQIIPFIEKATPSLKKLGSVTIAPAIANRIASSKLQAKLYLDRVKDRLLAAVEFQYDGVIFNPLEDKQRQPDSPLVVLRDLEQEQRILDLIEQCPFMKTESGYVMSEEEAEFDFLYNVVPQLEKLLKVYATTAVKVRVLKKSAVPKADVHVSPAERINWLEFRIHMGWIPETEIRSLVKSVVEKRRYYRLPNGSLLPLDSEELQNLVTFLNETGIPYSEMTESKIEIPLARGIHLLEHTFDGVKIERSIRQLLDNLRHPDNLAFPIPAPLAEVLRDYQKLGYQWMKTLAHYGFGGILADDMGLGKTLQSIAYLASILPDIRKLGTPALVICPGSLLYNWRNEIQKFAPDIRVLIADGNRFERINKMHGVAGVDVVVTSYPLLLRDAKDYAKQRFHSLILDEAQVFKNPSTRTAHAVKAIQADYRFALTGTSIENRLEELWSIFDVVFPALFQDLKTFSNLTLQEIAKRTRPFLLRRWKRDVLEDLPDKLESTKPVELFPEQKKLYAAYLAKLQQDTLKHLSVDGYQKSRIKILAGLTRLRQICCHPALFVQGYTGGSAKLEQLKEIVEEALANRKRLLIFSQFTDMLKLIGKELSVHGHPYFYLDGTTPSRERVELCNRFNDGEMDLFLISLKAGGTGLNLTGADTVVLYDLWWNPAIEQQAADRAHRIGQKNVVQIIRLITQGTMEEKMVELQSRKKHLIDEVLSPNQATASMLTEQDIREILMI